MNLGGPISCDISLLLKCLLKTSSSVLSHTKVLIKSYSSILSLIFIKFLLKLKLDAVHCFYSSLGCLTLLLVFFPFDLPSGLCFSVMC